MNVIGLDIGTTTICGIAVDAESGKLLKSITLDNDSFIDGKPFEKYSRPKLLSVRLLHLRLSFLPSFRPYVP